MKTFQSSGAQMSIFDFKEPLKITKPVRLIELFAGIGAQAKALENLGVRFEHYRIYEFDKYAVASYNAIHGTNFKTSDIKEIRAEDLGVVDTKKFDYIVTYSFPCTDISTAGKQQGFGRNNETRSSLLWEVERLLKEMDELPQILLMENVPGILSKKFKPDFNEWCNVLENFGYTNKFTCLNAMDYGVPQNRNRCYMVSWLGDYSYNFPQGIKMRPFVDYLDFDMRYAINPKKLSKTQKNCIKRLSSTLFSKSIRCGGGRSRDSKHIWSVYSVELLQSESFIKGNSLFLKNKSKTICAQHINSYTIDGSVYFDYSPRECWRLMGFNDEDFDKASRVCSNTRLYKQAGNSIVVDVLEAIFKEMF